MIATKLKILLLLVFGATSLYAAPKRVKPVTPPPSAGVAVRLVAAPAQATEERTRPEMIGMAITKNDLPVADRVEVIARARFARCSPDDQGMAIVFEYRRGGQNPLGMDSCSCLFGETTYILTTPDGQTHRMTPVSTGIGNTDRVDVFSYAANVRHILAKGTGFTRERLDYGWKETDIPDFTKPGVYRLIATGTIRSNTSDVAPFPFESTAAEWSVDPKALSLDALRAKAQELVEKRVEKELPPLDWTFSAENEQFPSSPVLSAVVPPKFLPENQIPPSDRYPAESLTSFGGKRYRFLFSSDGRLLSEKGEPNHLYPP